MSKFRLIIKGIENKKFLIIVEKETTIQNLSKEIEKVYSSLYHKNISVLQIKNKNGFEIVPIYQANQVLKDQDEISVNYILNKKKNSFEDQNEFKKNEKIPKENIEENQVSQILQQKIQNKLEKEMKKKIENATKFKIYPKKTDILSQLNVFDEENFFEN
ncbi:hypothetical protein M0811_04703 [Anaeramoeba ignava]|uniref:Nucleolar protein Dnt1-like N-terminal domain-containing protein n=1 Tax=Anaeramoeba ignava TaxID=1746090 RepID=A0A9Q0LX87_ANAIG|nr:hypothetical protein M0811_04703 [Anaeramoeba ignava]